MWTIQHLTVIIRNQQNKQFDILTKLAQAHLDYTREGRYYVPEQIAEVTTQGLPGPTRKTKKTETRLPDLCRALVDERGHKTIILRHHQSSGSLIFTVILMVEVTTLPLLIKTY